MQPLTLFGDVPFATVYIGICAFVATSALVLMYVAMVNRKKEAGTPFNDLLLKIVGGTSVLFWLTTFGTYVAHPV